MSATQARRARARSFALGLWLASRGGLVVAGIILATVGAIVAAVAAVALRVHPWTHLPVIASSAIAWSAGVTLAYGGATRALRSDREQGILPLALLRGVTAAEYTRGRVGGLVVALATVLGGAAVVAGLAWISATRGAPASLRAALAGLVYALFFAVTLGPLAMAALGARTRAGGHLTLLGVLVLPELFAPWTAGLLPRGFHELTSIPAALGALSDGVLAPAANAAHAGRALAGLVALVAVSLLVVRARLSGAWRERASGSGPTEKGSA